MRFLQTEWHRHERDRNAWEIEKQEMKARIASLEGQARRSDATQKALKKYVTILEKKVKDQAKQLKGEDPEADKFKEEQREAQLKEHLRSESALPPPSHTWELVLTQIPQVLPLSSPSNLHSKSKETSMSSEARTTQDATTSRPSSTSARPNSHIS